jgi:hypothetical protein
MAAAEPPLFGCSAIALPLHTVCTLELNGGFSASQIGHVVVDQTANEHGDLTEPLVAKTPQSGSHCPRPDPSSPVT